MKKLISVFAMAALLVGCSQKSLVHEPATESHVTPHISFSVEKQNITKASNLESVKHYNFGVWAWKVQGKNELADAEIMNHYLVGFSGTIGGKKVGYDPTNATTYAALPGSEDDHFSPWFYEKLGKEEYLYTGDAGYYKKTDADYMSVNDNQYLRYWDLAYAKTNFYCYAPYNKDVTFTKGAITSTMTFPDVAIRDGYDEPLNSAYANYSRTLGEFMYAGVQANNASLNDVTVPFKHMGAQLFIRFYEEIPGYKVEIIDLAADQATAPTTDIMKGIQATPAKLKTAAVYYNETEVTAHNIALPGALTSAALTADQAAAYNNAMSPETPKVAGDNLNSTEVAAYNAKLPGAITTETVKTPADYDAAPYYITQGATVTFTEATAEPVYAAKWEEAQTKTNTTPLMFLVPKAGLSTATDAPANLADFHGHNVIKEKVGTGFDQYSYSPTIYYPVAQPTTSTTGLTFHISYRVIAEDNQEVITVHNATVHVPYKVDETFITVWQPNVKYTYTFKFTRGSNGTTDPDPAIDPTDPDVSQYKALYPIVFDAATIEDYTQNVTEYTVSEDTSYQS